MWTLNSTQGLTHHLIRIIWCTLYVRMIQKIRSKSASSPSIAILDIKSFHLHSKKLFLPHWDSLLMVATQTNSSGSQIDAE